MKTTNHISYFLPPIKNVFPSEKLTLPEIHARITGNAYAGITKQLRAITDPIAQRKFKASAFPYVTFSGSFSQRKDTALLKSANLLVLDFDSLPNPENVRQQLLSDPYFQTELLFTSPSGHGLKWVLRYDPKCRHTEYFKVVAFYLQEMYGLHADPSGKDVSRACFLCHDPQAYLNPGFLEEATTEGRKSINATE